MQNYNCCISIVNVVQGEQNPVPYQQRIKVYVSSIACLKLGSIVYVNGCDSCKNPIISCGGYFVITEVQAVTPTCYQIIEMENIDLSFESILICKNTCIYLTGPQGERGPQGFTGPVAKLSFENINVDGTEPYQQIDPSIDITFIDSCSNPVPFGLTPIWSAYERGMSSTSQSGRLLALTTDSVYYIGDYSYAASAPQFLESINSNGSGFTPTLTNPPVGSQNNFIVKYDLNGNVLWNSSIQTTESSINLQIRGITANSTSVYVGGQFTGNTITMFNDDQTSSGLSVTNFTPSVTAAWLGKYDSSGDAQWILKMDGSANDRTVMVSHDENDNVYVCGNFSSNPFTFYNSNGSPGLSFVASAQDAFVAKYNSSGFLQWAGRVTGNSSEESKFVYYKNGFVYLTGTYTSSPATVFGGDGISSVVLPINLSSTRNLYLVKFNASTGAIVWANIIVNSVTDSGGASSGEGIQVDEEGNVYYNGYISTISNNVFFYNSSDLTTSVYTLPNAFPIAILTKYNSNGDFQWVSVLKSFSEAATNINRVYQLSYFNNNLYLTGDYNTNIELYNKQNTTTMPTLGSTLPYLGGASNLREGFIAIYSKEGNVLTRAKYGFNNTNEGSFGIGANDNGIFISGGYSNQAIVFCNSNDLPTSISNPAPANSNPYIAKYEATLSCYAVLVDYPSSEPFYKTITCLADLTPDIITVNVNNLLYQGSQVGGFIFDKKGQSITLLWTGTTWVVISNNNTTIF